MSTNSILATAPLVTTNFLLRATGTTIGNSLIFDNGTNVGIGNTNTTYKFDVSGTGRFTSYLDLTGGASFGPQLNIFSNNQSTNNITLAQGYAIGTDNIGYLYNRAAADFVFGTSNIERMRITSAGLVGIGTIAPNAGLEVVTDSGSFNALRLVSSRAYNLSTDVALTFRYLYDTTNYTSGGLIVVAKDNTTISNQSGNMQFYTNNAGTVAERMRITSGGQIGIGTPSVDSTISVDIQNTSPSSNNVFLRIKNNVGSEDVGIKIAGTYGTALEHTIGVNTIINSGDLICHNSNSLGYRWYVDGSQKMRITSAGAVSIASNVEIDNGYLSTSAGSGIAYSSKLFTSYSYPYIDTYLDSIAGPSYQSRLRFRVNANDAMSDKLILWYDGTITFSGLAGAGTRTVTVTAGGNLSTSSDSKLKQEDKEYAIGGLKELLQITPRAYKWLDDIEKRGEEAATELGFFADEVAPIIPSAAPKGNDDMYGFNDRALMAVMVKSIQELTERLNKLENK